MKNEHHHRRAPDHEQRPEVLERRDRDPGDAPRADDQHLARVAQVAARKMMIAIFANSAGWKVSGPSLTPR